MPKQRTGYEPFKVVCFKSDTSYMRVFNRDLSVNIRVRKDSCPELVELVRNHGKYGVTLHVWARIDGGTLQIRHWLPYQGW